MSEPKTDTTAEKEDLLSLAMTDEDFRKMQKTLTSEEMRAYMQNIRETVSQEPEISPAATQD